mgnify:CR=1 FL=1
MGFREWWKKLSYPQKGLWCGLLIGIFGSISIVVATTPFAVILLPFYLFVVPVYIIIELIFGFQGEFGALRYAAMFSLIIYPLFGYLFGKIIVLLKRRKYK